MIIYEFLCKKCGYKDEIRIPSSERNIPRSCPKCKDFMTRLNGTVSGIIFKGTGFYETDYKKKT